ncbi:hypothetical protein SAMN02745823_01890 [Sporobacter termitidis DSM 10068]|uniref:Uncharacterized protein n=1 Tax=Sporobacter termitidis DSM 10068 TaxID=1123282 RepID=A0A1M5XKB7_9FIRM|nr:hypothetical protein [Sporobacter termitidis]SHI00196.1 hypothetical protein SAMN02745823_01890 [Sporobacter termitidis DSM 10068]
MIVRYKNDGTYVPYALSGGVLSFNNGALTVDLPAQARDWPVQLDISENQDGALVLGPARRYVAQVGIPARITAIEKGPADAFGFPQLKKVTAPTDTAQVVLTLWALEV